MTWADWTNWYDWSEAQKCQYQQECLEHWDKSCQFLRDGKQFWRLTTAYSDEVWYEWLGIVGSVTSLLFFLIIWLMKELQVHPMRLFMYQSAVDSMIAFLHSTSLRQCELRLPDLLSYTLFFNYDWHHRFDSLNLLTNSGNNFLCFLNFVQIFLCILLCVDLVITLSRPFMQKERLIDFYMAISIIVSIFMTIVLLP